MIVVQVECAAGTNMVSVKDQGPGFADGDLSKLFDSFFSTKKMEWGSACPSRVRSSRAHNGTIRAERGPSGGAVFLVGLPADNASVNTA